MQEHERDLWRNNERRCRWTSAQTDCVGVRRTARRGASLGKL